jgi:protein TonB
LLDYPAGRYFFLGSLEKNVVPEIGGIPVPLGKLLLEAVRKAHDLPLDRLAEDAELRLQLSSDPLRLFKEVQLEDGEQRLLSLIGKGILAKDLVSQSGLPRPQACRALYALLLLQFVVGVPDAVKPDTARPEVQPVIPAPSVAVVEPPIGQSQETSRLSAAEDTKLPSSVAEHATEESLTKREEVKAVEAASGENIPVQRAENFTVRAEEVRASEAMSAENVSPAPGDLLSTEAILYSGVDAAGAPLAIEHDAIAARWNSDEDEEMQQPVTDFATSLPKLKRWRMPRGSFTPEFRRVALGLAILAGTLGLATVGAAWFRHWGPWELAGVNSKKNLEYSDTRVASDAPVTSTVIPAYSAPESHAGVAAEANEIEAPMKANSSSGAVAQPALKKNAAGGTTVGKTPPVRQAARPASKPQATGAKESALIPPKLLQAPRAVASLEALHDFERGNVVIDAVVGTSGEVNLISVISGPPALRRAAVESLKQYKYEPATRDGQPVPAHVTITIHFRFEP